MIQALVKGDADAFIRHDNPLNVNTIKETCEILDNLGLTRKARRGWMTFDHPDLGTVQWISKSVHRGRGFMRSWDEFFAFRINGRMIIRTKALEKSPTKVFDPRYQWRSYSFWVNAPKGLDPRKKLLVEAMLGTLQDGNLVDPYDWGDGLSRDHLTTWRQIKAS